MQRLLQMRVSERATRLLGKMQMALRQAHRLARADRWPVGHAGEDLGEMAYLDGAAAPRQPAGDIHQAAEIAREQDRGAARLGCLRLFLDNGGGTSPYLTANVPPKPQQRV